MSDEEINQKIDFLFQEYLISVGADTQAQIKENLKSIQECVSKAKEHEVTLVDEKEKLNTLNSEYDILIKEVKSLFPDAAAAGLAKAYNEQNSRLTQPFIFSQILFITTMSIMTYIGLLNLKVGNGLEDTITNFISTFPYLIPLIWLAVFSSKQQSQFKRLKEEYAFKESLSKSYHGFNNEAENLPDSPVKKEIKETLLKAIIKMSGENPSETLENQSHNDNPPLLMQWIALLKNYKEKFKTE